MARGWITTLALLLLSAQGNARPDCDKLACDEVKQAIREIESRMRSVAHRVKDTRPDCENSSAGAARSAASRLADQ
jgi:hypothetical protein